VIRCLLKRSEPVTVIGQPVRWRTCPSSLHSASGHLVQAATERIIGAATRSSTACPVKRGFGDTAAHVLEYRSRCVTIAGRSQRARSAAMCVVVAGLDGRRSAPEGTFCRAGNTNDVSVRVMTVPIPAPIGHRAIGYRPAAEPFSLSSRSNLPPTMWAWPSTAVPWPEARLGA